jgi:hypothetical protein
MTDALLTKARADFHISLLGSVLFVNKDGLLSNADKANKASIAITSSRPTSSSRAFLSRTRTSTL